MRGVLDGKVAIVTGAGRGIGRGEAYALAKEGAKVACIARTFDAVEQTAADIVAFGGEAFAISCDVRVVDQVNAAVQSVVDRWGTVDIMVNNAQILFGEHAAETWTEEEMRATWESGVLGSWAFMMACFPYMQAQGSGRIVNTVSSAGHGIWWGVVGYTSAKEGIRALTKACAREWGKYGINVNAIAPMAMSEFVESVYPDERDQIRILEEGIAVLTKRWGDAERDIGRSLVYLVGPDSEIVTGCTLSVDNGGGML
jgi:NAD(P)-dependent dehydrogenase (short-subunit alcohol dehydrogenase family)